MKTDVKQQQKNIAYKNTQLTSHTKRKKEKKPKKQFKDQYDIKRYMFNDGDLSDWISLLVYVDGFKL